jgi:F-type H+-transporting ATPase subunit delta
MAGDTTTIARPYAEAAFAVARDANQLDAWSDALCLIAAIAEDPQVAGRIGNPNIPRDALEALVLGVAGDELPQGAVNLVKAVTANDRLVIMPEVARLFEELKAAQQGVRNVLVRSAFPLTDAEQSELLAALKGHFGAEIELSVEQDDSLIGGVEVRADDVVIDGSVRGRLQQLSTALQF